MEWFSKNDTRWWGLGAVSLVILMGILTLVLRRWMEPSQAIGVSFFIVFGLGALMLGIWPRIKPAQAVPPANTWWHHYDWLKRPVAVTDDASGVVWRAMYNPFGEVVATSGDLDLFGTVLWQPYFRFDGQYEDREVQDTFPLFYNWHRTYLPEVGRYNRVDPWWTISPLDLEVIGEPALLTFPNPLRFPDPEFLHNFAYVGNMPIIYTDNKGLFWNWIMCWWHMRKLTDLRDQCEKECNECGANYSRIECQVRYMDKYNANFIGEANLYCMNQKDPKRAGKAMKYCFKSTYKPRLP